MLPYTPLHHLLFGGRLLRAGDDQRQLERRADRHRQSRSGRSGWTPSPTRSCFTIAIFTPAWTIRWRVSSPAKNACFAARAATRRIRSTLGFPVAEILACGAELKNTFCLTKQHHAFLSQHIGDLENYETLVFYRETLDRMKQLFRIAPTAVAYDLHPQYLSTKLALEMTDLQQIGVQHHHAHIASCMAENGITEKVIGVAFDGTGFGTDGKIWGGEFLVADFAGFERRAHFRYIPLAGGDTRGSRTLASGAQLSARYVRRASSIRSICRCSAASRRRRSRPFDP